MTLGIRHIAIAASAVFGLLSGAMADAQPDRVRYHQVKTGNPYTHIAPRRAERPFIAPNQQLAAVNVSPSQAKSIALRHVRGSEFLDIKLVGGNTYIVRVIKAGRRIDVYIDANTGRVKG